MWCHFAYDLFALCPCPWVTNCANCKFWTEKSNYAEKSCTAALETKSTQKGLPRHTDRQETKSTVTDEKPSKAELQKPSSTFAHALIAQATHRT
jgi:hypothetical protein